MRLRKKADGGSGSGADPEPRSGGVDADVVESGGDEAAGTPGSGGRSGGSGGSGKPSHGLSSDELALIEQHEAEVALLQAPASQMLERWTGIALVALSLLGLLGSQNITLRNHVNETFGPRWWPTALCLISLALSLALAVVAFVRPPFEREGVEQSTREGWYKLIITLIVEALYVVAWTLSNNFVVPSVVMLAVMLWVYGTRSWKMLIAFPIVTVALIYALFDLLLEIPL